MTDWHGFIERYGTSIKACEAYLRNNMTDTDSRDFERVVSPHFLRAIAWNMAREIINQAYQIEETREGQIHGKSK